MSSVSARDQEKTPVVVVPLTEEQWRPLTTRGASVSLSAGAGCGKTTVLTSRFLDALEQGNTGEDSLSLRSLVALTFTEKAARELRKRIREVCHLRLKQSTAAEAHAWRMILRGLEAAPVSTFHEYCASLLRRHALDAGIDPDFQILDETISSTVRDEALSRCVRRWLADENADLIALAVEDGLRQTREAIDQLVVLRDASELRIWETRTEEEILGLWRCAWEQEGREILFRPVRNAVHDCACWLRENTLDHPKLQTFRSELIEGLQTPLFPTSLPALAELRKLTLFPRGLRVVSWPSPALKEEAERVIKGLREAIDNYLAKAEPDEDATRLCARNSLRLTRLAIEARAAYDDAKIARGGLDFDDLLVKTRDLLRADAAAVRDSPGHPVSFVLVDEFQDTDPVQSEILKHLGGETFTSGTFFVVGDYKQSIYRFRGAEPRLFQEYRDTFPPEGRHTLSENFRSTTGILDFVNALFEKAFEGETPRLRPGPRSTPSADTPAVEFVWAEEAVEEMKDTPREQAGRTGVDECRKTEARWLARILRTRLDAGWPIRDRASKRIRHAHAGDVAFLFRAMTDVSYYEHALETENFDFLVVGGKSFYAQQEVVDLVNVLSVIEDPCDGVSLAGALRGPFFGLSDDALFWLGSQVEGELTEGRSGDTLAFLTREDRQGLARAQQLLARWRGLKDRLSIAALVDRVLDESGFEAALLGEFLGDRKRANARKLVRLARRFDARGGFTLAHFVARLRADLRDPPREEQASTTEEAGTSVRLMSIHQAKGLEFPIVIVPDLNRKQELRRNAVAFPTDLGPLLRSSKQAPASGPGFNLEGMDDDGPSCSLGWLTYKARERVEEEAEAIRLLYVATTRARDALLLSAGADADAKPACAAVRLLAEQFDRRTGACRAPLPSGWSPPPVRVITECPSPTSPSPQARRRRAKLRAVARLIGSVPEKAESSTSGETATPLFVELDPGLSLSPRGVRVFRLVRSILADPRALTKDEALLDKIATQVARRQDPPVQGDLVREALTELQPWLSGPLGEGLARATVVERGVEWTLTWPPGATGSTVFHGRTEFFARDSHGSWRAVVFSPPGATEALERLRLLLSARAAGALGFGPVVEGWRIELGKGLLGEEEFDDERIATTVREALAEVRTGRE
ncbi:MAG: hypothetical protein NVSMB9_20410 [Isosphaeraceae bacterium]